VSENRQHPRQPVQAPIATVAYQVGDAGPRVDAVCENISLGGMFIQTSSPPAFGTSITVFLTLPGFKQESAIKAVVRWTKSTGMGVQFGTMGARETHALTELVNSASSRCTLTPPERHQRRWSGINAAGAASTPLERQFSFRGASTAART
jgi:type IV pilus assembly protein PilZ